MVNEKLNFGLRFYELRRTMRVGVVRGSVREYEVQIEREGLGSGSAFVDREGSWNDWKSSLLWESRIASKLFQETSSFFIPKLSHILNNS